MKPAPLAMLLAAVALLGLRLRLDSPGDLQAGVLATAPGSVEAERDAWRLRLIELAWAGDAAPREDLLLGIGAVPWPPLFTSGLAQVARRLAPRAVPAPQAPLDRGAGLRAVVEIALLVSGVLAILAVFACARALAAGPSADLAGLVAAATYALLPPVVFAERIGRVDPHAWLTILGCAMLGGTALALRAREQVDATLGGLLAGLAAGLGLACDVGALPAIVSALGALTIAALRGRRDLWRAWVLFLVAAAVLATMPWRLPAWGELLPAALPWSQGAGFERLRAWPAAVLLPAALVALASARRRSEHLELQLLVVAAIAWALACDPHAAGVHLAAALACGVAAAERVSAARPNLRALPLGVLVLVAGPALLFARAPSYAVPEAELVARRARAFELGRFGAGLRAPAPWNHPTARADWRLLCAPGFGASTALGARLPVLAASVPGVRPGDEARSRGLEAAALLVLGDEQAFVDAARRAGVRFVVAAPEMAADMALRAALEEAPPSDLFTRLCGAPSGPPLTQLVPVELASDELAFPGGSGLRVWRVPSGKDSGEPAVLRSR